MALHLLLFPGGLARAYCESETFRARCWTDHVIVMQRAFYGRMRIGRCVASDLGYLGCQSDVLAIADTKCSAQHECEIRIPDGDFDDTKPCFKELKVYFEANYTCLRGRPIALKLIPVMPLLPSPSFSA